MTELVLIRDLAIVWLAALLTGYLCLRLKQPLITGYMLAGVAIGPYGMKLITQPGQISALSELGVALLLFALGVELSLKQVFRKGHRVIIAGIAQILATTFCVFAFYNWSNTVPVASSLLFGLICALSSTAVVTKILTDRGEADSLHGRTLIAILLIQDLSLVPMISLLPVMHVTTDGAWVAAVGLALTKALILTGVIVLAAERAVPVLLSFVARLNSRELFLLTVIGLCLTVALLSKELGLSLALGAFLAGIMISEFPYGHQALADVLPIRDLFSTVFFVSVGMRLDPVFVADHPAEVIVFVLILIIGKSLIGTLSALIAAPHIWSALLVGVGLAQIGEFSFVLATLGYNAGILTTNQHNLFFAGSVVTLIATPILMTGVPRALMRLRRFRMVRPERRFSDRRSESTAKLSDHVILCGFGRAGRNVGMILKAHGIPFVVIETNGALIEDLRLEGIPCVYGDAGSRTVLLKANLRKASCLVLTVPDPLITTAIVSFVRHISPTIKIIARAHLPEDIEVFRTAGANAVVQPEFEASIELTRLTLLSLDRPREEIQKALHDIHSQRYMLFHPEITESKLSHLMSQSLDETAGAWFKVPDSTENKISRNDIEQATGTRLIAVKRNETVVSHPPPDTILNDEDEIYIVGNSEELALFETQFNWPRFCPMSEATSDEVSQP